MAEIFLWTTVILLLLVVIFALYAAIIGKMGWQVFKYNFPFLKKKGAWTIIWEKRGSFRVEYNKFKPEHQWKDGSKTYISRGFDRVSKTAEPLIFLIEGWATNVQLGLILPKFEINKFFNSIVITSHEQGALSKLQEAGKGDVMFKVIIPLVTLLLVFLSLLAVVFAVMKADEIAKLLKPIAEQMPTLIESVRAAVPKTL